MLANRKPPKPCSIIILPTVIFETKFALLSGSARREVDSATGAQTGVARMWAEYPRRDTRRPASGRRPRPPETGRGPPSRAAHSAANAGAYQSKRPGGPSVSGLTRAHGVVVSHPLRMRKALGSIPSVSIDTCKRSGSNPLGLSENLLELSRFPGCKVRGVCKRLWPQVCRRLEQHLFFKIT